MPEVHTNNKGFTLIELLVVIAIIGVLSGIILFAINPLEILRKSRDSVRIQDFSNIKKAIDSRIAEGNTTILPLVLCTYTAPCKSLDTETRSTDGSGWIHTDIRTYLSVLPVDPRNGQSGVTNSAVATVTPYYYFASDGAAYRLATYLESTANVLKTSNDGGTESNMYEVGTDLTTDIVTP